MEKPRSLGEIFPLFSYATTSIEGSNKSLSIQSLEKINIGFTIGELPLVIDATSSITPDVLLKFFGIEDPDLVEDIQKVHRINAVTPFGPQIGYQITRADYDQRQRSDKILHLQQTHELDVNGEDPFPLILSAGSDDHLIDKGLGKVDAQGYWKGFLNPLDYRFIQRLRFQVMFPNWIAYQSLPDQELLEDGSISFTHFHPLSLNPLAEMGPLANLSGTSLDRYENGVWIHVPADHNQLNLIQGRIVLLPH